MLAPEKQKNGRGAGSKVLVDEDRQSAFPKHHICQSKYIYIQIILSVQHTRMTR